MPHGEDRRRVIVADDGTVLDTRTKMMWHFETAKMFTSIGYLPASLFDNDTFKAWVGTVTRGSYQPPNKKWLGATTGPAVPLMSDMLIEDQTALISEGRVFFKGVPFQHLTFDCWTSRMGFPFLGLDNGFTAPWRLHRDCMTDVFEGEDRTLISMLLKHLTGRHTGDRIAVAVTEMPKPYGTKGKWITLPVGSYEADTDLSDEVASPTTDNGGGVPAACRRLGRKHKHCGLHGSGTVLGCMFGLAQKHCPPELAKVRDLFKKVFALAAYFHQGDHVQRVAHHKPIQLELSVIAAAAALFEV